MKQCRIIGNMTGNSMDAIDLVLTEFNNNKMKDICTYSKPYTKNMQEKMEYLRAQVSVKTQDEILNIPHFHEIHDEYISEIATSINDMLEKYRIDKHTIRAIGFHGKTLDHNPPSKAKKLKQFPYTLQIGSGQMLADLTGIDVVYDFRSIYIQNNFEGAPLVSPHNAHVSQTEGDGCYINGGNTSNFAWIIDGKATEGADAGPCNEYVDNFIRKYTNDTFDEDGRHGKRGTLNKELLQKLFDTGRQYYERPLPKSGDPQYYFKDEIFRYIEKNKKAITPTCQDFFDTVYTLEYFSAYIVMQALTLSKKEIKLPSDIILFGGGWKNPVIRQSFEDLLQETGYILPEHERIFREFIMRFTDKPKIRYSNLGEFMEARLFADMARYRLENKVWEVPEVIQSKQKIVSGIIATPESNRKSYADKVNQAAFGWWKNQK